MYGCQFFDNSLYRQQNILLYNDLGNNFNDFKHKALSKRKYYQLFV